MNLGNVLDTCTLKNYEDFPTIGRVLNSLPNGPIYVTSLVGDEFHDKECTKSGRLRNFDEALAGTSKIITQKNLLCRDWTRKKYHFLVYTYLGKFFTCKIETIWASSPRQHPCCVRQIYKINHDHIRQNHDQMFETRTNASY